MAMKNRWHSLKLGDVPTELPDYEEYLIYAERLYTDGDRNPNMLLGSYSPSSESFYIELFDNSIPIRGNTQWANVHWRPLPEAPC